MTLTEEQIRRLEALVFLLTKFKDLRNISRNDIEIFLTGRIRRKTLTRKEIWQMANFL